MLVKQLMADDLAPTDSIYPQVLMYAANKPGTGYLPSSVDQDEYQAQRVEIDASLQGDSTTTALFLQTKEQAGGGEGSKEGGRQRCSRSGSLAEGRCRAGRIGYGSGGRQVMVSEKVFAVSRQEPGEAETAPAGVLSIGAQCRLTRVSAEPDFEDRLELAVETLNDNDTFLIRAKQSPNAPPMTLTKRAVARTDADAEAAVMEKLRKEYGLIRSA